MSIEKSVNDPKRLFLSKSGLFSFLIGIGFWIFAALWISNTFYLDTFIQNTLGRILDGNSGEKWITVVFMMVVVPLVSHFMGLTLGLVGLKSFTRKFAIFGLIINAILPLLLLVNWIYRLMFGYPNSP